MRLGQGLRQSCPLLWRRTWLYEKPCEQNFLTLHCRDLKGSLLFRKINERKVPSPMSAFHKEWSNSEKEVSGLSAQMVAYKDVV